MDGGADLEGEIGSHNHTARRKAAFREVRFDLPRSGEWGRGACRLVRGDGGVTEVACATLSTISAGGARFPVHVEAGEARHGPFDAEGVTVAFPPGADAFVFRRDAEGFWEGVTLTSGFRGLVVSSFSCDPL